jgi:hypothetical protein
MRLVLLRYLTENFDDLLLLDLKLARLLGAPAPHTLSSWVHHKRWKVLEKIIDHFFKWLLNQDNHCQRDYQRCLQLQTSKNA